MPTFLAQRTGDAAPEGPIPLSDCAIMSRQIQSAADKAERVGQNGVTGADRSVEVSLQLEALLVCSLDSVSAD